MDLRTAEKTAKWQKSNLAIIVVTAIAIAVLLTLLLLIGVFKVAVPFWAFLVIVPFVAAVRILQMRTRLQMLDTAESAYESQSTMLTDNTLAAAQKDYRANKRRS